MPLSEHEQRLLDEIEHALYAEDPKFASSVRVRSAHSHRRRNLGMCVFGVLLGLGLVLVGLLASVVALSVIGFVCVVCGCAALITALRPHPARAPRSTETSTTPSAAPRPDGLRGRMEGRLRRRFDEN